jgi:hypothetical protein
MTRSTYPSRYYERSAAQREVVMECRKRPYLADDGEFIATMIGLVVFGFALGMLLVAWWAGIL